MVNKISSVSTVVQLSSQLVGGAFACNFHNFQWITVDCKQNIMTYIMTYTKTLNNNFTKMSKQQLYYNLSQYFIHI